MKMNTENIMVVTNEQENLDIEVDGVGKERVNAFKHLGVTTENSGRQEREINRKIAYAIKVYHSINTTLINKKEVTRKTKMTV